MGLDLDHCSEISADKKVTKLKLLKLIPPLVWDGIMERNLLDYYSLWTLCTIAFIPLIMEACIIAAINGQVAVQIFGGGQIPQLHNNT